MTEGVQLYKKNRMERGRFSNKLLDLDKQWFQTYKSNAFLSFDLATAIQLNKLNSILHASSNMNEVKYKQKSHK